MVTRKLLRRFPRLHAAYQGYRESKQWSQPSTMTSLGFQLTGNAAMQSGAFEPVETAIVQSILNEVDVVINVGANIGYYCCIALAAGKQVVAFEPMPNNLRMLYRNMESNGWQDAIEIFPIALSSRIGIINIFGGGTGASLVEGWAGQGDDRVTTVPASTLDRVVGHRFGGSQCFVLVDIEGAEWHMLQGASQLLGSSPRPIWMVEIAVAEHQPAGIAINPHLLQTFELFEKAGYVATTAEAIPRPVPLDEVRQVALTGRDTLKTHNFIFR